jgi:hypothetical protein
MVYELHETTTDTLVASAAPFVLAGCGKGKH